MKTIRANVLYPVYGVNVTVADDATQDEQREALLRAADYGLENTGIEPLIEECSIPELNTIPTPKAPLRFTVRQFINAKFGVYDEQQPSQWVASGLTVYEALLYAARCNQEGKDIA